MKTHPRLTNHFSENCLRDLRVFFFLVRTNVILKIPCFITGNLWILSKETCFEDFLLKKKKKKLIIAKTPLEIFYFLNPSFSVIKVYE